MPDPTIAERWTLTWDDILAPTAPPSPTPNTRCRRAVRFAHMLRSGPELDVLCRETDRFAYLWRNSLSDRYYELNAVRGSARRQDQLNRIVWRHGNERLLLDMIQRVTGYTLARCAWTDKFFNYMDGIQVGTERVSPAGFEQYGAHCEDCGAAYRRDGNHTLCPSCAAAGRFENNYSDSVLTSLEGFRADKGEKLPLRPLWLGVELEVEARDNFSSAMVALKRDVRDFCILKPDGSLGEKGIEIVSVPASLEYHRKAWTRFFENSAAKVRGWHGHSCGMHVHLSANAFTTLSLAKMMVFINSDQNAEFIDDVAGRGPTGYCVRRPKQIEHGVQAKRHGSDHYEAIGVSRHNHKKTVEIRIFRSNVNSAGFYKNLEFCDALPRWAKSASVQDLGYMSFCLWVQAHHRDYPALTAWLGAHKYLEGREAYVWPEAA